MSEEQPMETKCLRCKETFMATTMEAIEHEERCRKTTKSKGKPQ